MKQLYIYIEDEDLKEIETLSEITGIKKSVIVRILLKSVIYGIDKYRLIQDYQISQYDKGGN